MNEKVATAIERLKAFEPEEGYYLAFSGGKDSICIKALADMAGVKYTAFYRITSVDPPELVQFIKDYHPDVKREIPLDNNGKAISMWTLIPQKKMPPTRIARYCCDKLKESGGTGKLTVTGVRWAESVNRARTQGIVSFQRGGNIEGIEKTGFESNGRGGYVLLNDNADARKMVEHCYAKRRTVINPIIDWTDGDVWAFIRAKGLPYCKLYDCGFKRIGCIGCPMATYKERRMELKRWPKYREAYLKAFQRMIQARREKGIDDQRTPEDVMRWWLEDKNLEGQTMLEGFEEDWV